ncbi:MAG: thioredoxin-disulfide reductase [Clostridia bacterium]|nr:thioredoxin-disulfide reductase [Clostridia bacterium]
MERIYDMIIIGGGPAGYTAALYAARAGLDTLIIERLSVGGQMTLTGDIDNYPGFPDGIDGFTLGMNMQVSAEKFGASTYYGEVLSAELSGKIKTVTTDSGKLFSKTVVIATGADPKRLGIEREEELTGMGVYYCAHCDGRFYKEKTVAVVGGGNSAAGDALYLSRLCKKVYLIHRRDTLKATKIYHEPLMKAENVEFIWDSAVSEILFADGFKGLKIKNLKTENVENIVCDGVFISIDRKPSTEFLGGQLPLDESGYIKADETTETQIDGVYAVGDVRTKPFRQVVTAVGDGATAVHFAEEYLAKGELI